MRLFSARPYKCTKCKMFTLSKWTVYSAIRCAGCGWSAKLYKFEKKKKK